MTNNPDTNWHVLTVSRGGAVSLITNVSEEIAGQIVRKLTPAFKTDVFWPNDSDMIRVEAFGPETKTQAELD